MATDWDAKLKAMHNWVLAGSGLTSQEVVWGQQDAPRPRAPSIALRISNISDLGSTWLDYEANPLVFADKLVSAVSTAADTLTSVAHGLLTGDGPVRVTSTGTTPNGVDADMDVWVVRVDADTIKIADSFQSAIATVPVTLDLTSTGTGTISIVDLPESLRAGQELVAVSRGLIRVTLEVHCHADPVIGADMAVAILQRIRTRRELPSQVAILEAANIALQDVERVRAILGSRDDFLFEPRAFLDVHICMTVEESEYQTIIERVFVTNQIVDPEQVLEIP